MPPTRIICCLCGEDTADVPPDEYVELCLLFPEVPDALRQWCGAHRSCLVERLSPHVTVEGPG